MKTTMIISSVVLVSLWARAEVPIQVATAISGAFACALGSEGHVRCWGANERGQAGYPTQESTVIPGPTREPVDLDYATHGGAISITLGTEHACALMSDNAVVCWGNNDSGQLGRGDTSPGDVFGKKLIPAKLGKKSGRVASLAAGASHTCALFASGAVKCWGDRGFNRLAMRKGTADRYRDMGDQLPEVDFDGARVQQISAGLNHTCALTEYRTVRCWGENQRAQLGFGFDGFSFGHDRPRVPEGTTGQDLDFKLGDNESIQSVQAGETHTCVVIHADGGTDQVKCVGINTGGALGIGKPDRDRNFNTVSRAAYDAEPVLLGLNEGETIQALTVGASRSCVLLRGGRVKCWGANSDGELGEGDKIERGLDKKDLGTNLPELNLAPGFPVETISYRSDFGCAIVSGVDEIKCWGMNGRAQAGSADQVLRGKAPDEMGNNLPYVDVGF